MSQELPGKKQKKAEPVEISLRTEEPTEPIRSIEDVVVGVVSIFNGFSGSHQKALDFWHANEQRLNLPHVESIDEMSQQLILFLQLIHPHVSLQDAGRGAGFLGTDGVLAYENPHAKLVVQDEREIEDGTREHPELVKLLRKNLEALKTPPSSPCKVHVMLHRSGIVSARFDPGSHKEYVAYVPGKDSESRAYLVHTPSSYEREQPSSFRSQYMQRALKETNCYAHREEQKGGQTAYVAYTSADFAVPVFIRLALSVKDLDLSLRSSEDARMAAHLFASGSINIKHMLMYTDIGRAFDASQAARVVQENEITIIEDVRSEQENHQRRVESVGIFASKLREARAANYIALGAMQTLVVAVEALLAGEHTSKAQSPRQVYERCRMELIRMRDAVRELHPFAKDDIDLERLAHEHEEHIQNIEQFDYVRDLDYSVQHTARDRARMSIRQLTTHTSPRPRQFAQVRSLNDAVTYMHELMYSHSLGLRNVIFAMYIGSNVESARRQGEEYYGYSIIDASKNGWKNTRGGELLDATLLRIGETNNPQESRDLKPVVIIHYEYMELSFPTGKHRMEIEFAYNDKEYTAFIQHFESGYDGSSARKKFLDAAVQRSGFRLGDVPKESTHRMTQAYVLTQDIDTWKFAAETLLRLPYALRDMDLYPGVADIALDLFEHGVTRIGCLGNDFYLITLFGDPAYRGQYPGDYFLDSVKRILRDGNQDEKNYLRRLCADLGVLALDAAERFPEFTPDQLHTLHTLVD